MKIMKGLILISVLVVFVAVSYSQVQKASSIEANSKMAALDFMAGDWQGEGWIQMGRERKTFKIQESFTRKLDGSLVVVEGLGVNTNTETGVEEVIHRAYGVFYYDEGAKRIGFRYFKEDGAGGQTFPEFSENQLIWGFVVEPSKSKVRFVERIDGDGFWIANGEVMPPGRDQWIPFFYMKLSRVE